MNDGIGKDTVLDSVMLGGTVLMSQRDGYDSIMGLRNTTICMCIFCLN